MTNYARQIFDQLLKHLGPQHWWPGESPFEVMVGTVLVQNTSWKNVERAISNLRDADLVDPGRLAAVAVDELQDLIRPAGYYRIKSTRLRNLLALVNDRYDGSLEAMRKADSYDLREQLLAVHGIGPETADSILLYALEKPAFVVDAYTHRIFSRHGWIGFDIDYHQLQEEITSQLPQEVSMFNEFHALLVHVGHHYCHKRNPQCDDCPLCDMLPEGGIVSE